jgi:hypothetical protein
VDERTLTAIITALEVATAPLTAKHWPDLDDPAVRAEIDRRLRGAGRQLLMLTVALDGDDNGAVGYISSYDDTVADRLAREPRPGLAEQDLAVLAMVLLYGVLMPHADGRLPGSSWATGIPVAREQLTNNPHLRDRHIDESLTRLRAAGLVGRNNVPGAALWRLSPQRQALLWENVVLLCRPGGALAAEIRRQRTQRAATAIAASPAGDGNPKAQEARS